MERTQHQLSNGMPRLLVAEDDDKFHPLWGQAFIQAGIDAVAALFRSARDLIEHLSAEAAFPSPPLPFNSCLVLLDLQQLPEDNFHVLGRLRSQPRLRPVVAIVVSPSADPAQISRAYKFGANSYLVRPDTFDGLVSLISAVYSYWGQWDQMARGVILPKE